MRFIILFRHVIVVVLEETWHGDLKAILTQRRAIFRLFFRRGCCGFDTPLLVRR